MLMVWFLNCEDETVTLNKMFVIHSHTLRTLCSKSSQLSQTCKYSKYSTVDSVDSMVTITYFSLFLQEKLITMKIFIHCYNKEAKLTTKTCYQKYRENCTSVKVLEQLLTDLFCMNVCIGLHFCIDFQCVIYVHYNF